MERANGHAPEAWRERSRLLKELTGGLWLAEDRRPKQVACCSPLEKWTEERVSKPWGPEPKMADEKKVVPEPVVPMPLAPRLVAGPEVTVVDAAKTDKKEGGKLPVAARWNRGVRCQELAFAADSTISKAEERGVGILPTRPKQQVARMATLHLANQAFGIGDAITGL